MTNIRLPRLLDHSLKELARLEPISLSIEMNLAPLSTAIMMLPPDAPPVETGQFVELFTRQGSAGIFRIEQVERSYPGGIRLSLAHSLVTLSDSLLISSEDTTLSAGAYFRQILAQQTQWTPGSVALPEDALITWRSEACSLLEALLALLQEFPGYQLIFDQSATPWVLHVQPLSSACAAECRLTRNLRSLTIETDRSDLCTQLYLPGMAEPLQADTIARCGTVSRSLMADTDLTEQELTARGMQYLEQHKEPQITVSMDAVDLCAITGSALDSFHLGSLCRVCLPEENSWLLHRIVTLSYPDVYGTPELVRISLSNNVRRTDRLLAGLILEETHVRRQLVRHWDELSAQKELIIAAEESIALLSESITLQAEDMLTLRSGMDDNAAQITLMDGRISANANEIDLHAKDILTLRSGVDDNAAQITLMDGRISANANEIDLHAKDILTLRSGIDGNTARIDLMDGRISANANEIDLHAKDILTLRSGIDGNAARIDLMDGRISANANEIEFHANSILTLRSGVDNNASRISLMNGRISAQADEISLKADKIDLEGYVTASQLETQLLEVLTGATIQGSLFVEDTLDAYTLVGSEAFLGATEVTSLTIDGEDAATQAWVNGRYDTMKIWVNANYADHTWVTEHFPLKSALTTATATVVSSVNTTSATTPPFYNANGTQVSSGVTYISKVTYNTTDLTYLVYA